jgi:hypothetical protein
MPQVPNLTYRNIDLPFDLGTGITNTKAASPFKIGISEILNRYNVPNSQSQDLVNKLIAENQMKASQFDPTKFRSIFPTNVQTGIRQQVPEIAQDTIASNLLYEDMPSGGDYDYDYDYESIQPFQEEQKKSNQGLAGLFKTLIGFAIPGANLFMGDRSALEGIKSLNQKIQKSNFGRSKSFSDYFDMMKYGGYQGREDARARNMAQARGLQKQIDQRQSAVQTNRDRARGDRPGGANYSAPSKPSKASSYRDSSSFGTSFHA